MPRACVLALESVTPSQRMRILSANARVDRVAIPRAMMGPKNRLGASRALRVHYLGRVLPCVDRQMEEAWTDRRRHNPMRFDGSIRAWALAMFTLGCVREPVAKAGAFQAESIPRSEIRSNAGVIPASTNAPLSPPAPAESSASPPSRSLGSSRLHPSHHAEIYSAPPVLASAGSAIVR